MFSYLVPCFSSYQSSTSDSIIWDRSGIKEYHTYIKYDSVIDLVFKGNYCLVSAIMCKFTQDYKLIVHLFV